MISRKGQSGLSLIELMVAAAIMLVAVALASSLMITGVRLARDGEVRTQESDEARLALGELVKSVRSAGMGAPRGFYVRSNGNNTLANAIFGTDASSTDMPGADDLWVVAPDGNALREGCPGPGSTMGDPGAATSIIASGTGPLQVVCTGKFTAGDLLMASNMDVGALLTGTVLGGSPATIDYAESNSGLSNTPSKGGFQKGDMVFRVNVWHYLIKKDARGVPGLYRAKGKPSGSGGGTTTSKMASQVGGGGGTTPAVTLFVDDGEPVLVQERIEDLQVAYGMDYAGNGDPAGFTWVDSLGSDPQFSSGGIGGSNVSGASSLGGSGGMLSGRQDLLGGTTNALRAIRLSVVVRGAKKATDNGGATWTSMVPLAKVENHTQANTAPDGYRRMLANRLLELPNLSPGSL